MTVQQPRKRGQFELGQRVEATESNPEIKPTNRRGVVVEFSIISEKYVAVQTDGRKYRMRYHVDFWRKERSHAE